MEENQKKAFDFAADLTKQLITLSTAIITLSVTFSKDIIGGIDHSNSCLLIWSWSIFIFSIACGIWSYMALTGNLESKQNNSNPIFTIYAKGIRIPSIFQIITFAIALILICIYGYQAAASRNTEIKQKECYKIIRETKLEVDSTKFIDTLYIQRNK